MSVLFVNLKSFQCLRCHRFQVTVLYIAMHMMHAFVIIKQSTAFKKRTVIMKRKTEQDKLKGFTVYISSNI